ncbi:MAG: hypothetical protein GC131_03290 [Alphaproteobacteria bacterium]|nr:hypothetical protein [Alphaproteobacteria bacterium]
MQPHSVELVIPQKTLPLPGREIARVNPASPNRGYGPQNASEYLQLQAIQSNKSSYNQPGQQTGRAELRLVVEFNPASLGVQATAAEPPPKQGLRGALSSDVLSQLLSLKNEADASKPAYVRNNNAADRYSAAEQHSPIAADSLFSFAV